MTISNADKNRKIAASVMLHNMPLGMHKYFSRTLILFFLQPNFFPLSRVIKA
jgi:hypothetical protein